jgi:hypothetical protein
VFDQVLNYIPVAFSDLSEACSHQPTDDEFVDALAKKERQITKIELVQIDAARFHNHSCVF